MSTIIRIKGANFGNPSLPVLAPILRDGLVGAWRFATDSSSLVDLSGNDRQLTLKGEVAYTSRGVIGDIDNGFVTDIPETQSMTLISVFRVPLQVTNSNGGFIVGNYNTTLAGITRGGVSLNVDKLEDVGTPTVSDRIKYVSEGMYKLTSTSVNTKVDVLSPTQVNSDSQFIFAATVIDAVNNQVRLIIPALNITLTSAITDGTVNGRNLSPELLEILSSPVAGTGYGRSTGTRLQLEVSEVLIFNKALTNLKVLEQYYLTQSFMRRIRSLSI